LNHWGIDATIPPFFAYLRRIHESFAVMEVVVNGFRNEERKVAVSSKETQAIRSVFAAFQ
jgi:hypothetical protein